MADALELAPGIPSDYYERIFDCEERHWWYVGMRSIAAALLGERCTTPGRRVLDAGCGTGGVLRWQADLGGAPILAGVDIGSAAIELARQRVPEADLHVAPLVALPFDDAVFDLVLTNDVLQHVPEDDVQASLVEVRRVLDPGGVLLLRTNGARKLRRERDDWRAYDRPTLVEALQSAGFRCERATYANALLSVAAIAQRRTPHAPSDEHHGIPTAPPSGVRAAVGDTLLAAEARWLAHRGRTLPYGHTLFALCTPA
jgi:ubiquinone/menaquinone biosynthesis C-methylase UbiE